METQQEEPQVFRKGRERLKRVSLGVFFFFFLVEFNYEYDTVIQPNTLTCCWVWMLLCYCCWDILWVILKPREIRLTSKAWQFKKQRHGRRGKKKSEAKETIIVASNAAADRTGSRVFRALNGTKCTELSWWLLFGTLANFVIDNTRTQTTLALKVCVKQIQRFVSKHYLC